MRIIDTIRNAETFLILSHIGPDGDAVASSMAMHHLLRTLGKKADNIEIYMPYVSKDLTFIDKDNALNDKREISNKDYNLVIIVDCSNYSRVEGIELLDKINYKKSILIDHHESADNLIKVDYSLIDTSASSCTCVIYNEFAEYLNGENRQFFSYIATGIISDTVNLTLNATIQCKEILKYCQERGVDIEEIVNQLKSIDERTQKLMNLVNTRLLIRNDIGYTYILQKDLVPEEFNLKRVNHKAIIQEILNSKECKTLILLIENNKHEIKGSMRTLEADINLNDICTSMLEKGYFLQGGGHSNSAGFKRSISTETIATMKNIFEVLTKVISKN